MIDHKIVNQWLQDYVNAWKSYDPQAIRTLFSENAAYRISPFADPVRGCDAIVASWLDNPDDPNTYDATYKAIAVDGDTAVAQGRTSYYLADGKTLERQFHNIFVLKFDADGRCADFCDWYMQPRN